MAEFIDPKQSSKYKEQIFDRRLKKKKEKKKDTATARVT